MLLVKVRLVPVRLPAKGTAAESLIVKVAAAPLSVTVPVPATLATCCEKPARSKVPLTVRAVPVGIALATPSARVALELTVVVPL